MKESLSTAATSVEVQEESKKKRTKSTSEWSTAELYYHLLIILKDEADAAVGTSYKGLTAAELSKKLQENSDLKCILKGKNYRETVSRNLLQLKKLGELSGLFEIVVTTNKEDVDSKKHTYYKYKGVVSPSMIRLLYESFARVKGISSKDRDRVAEFVEGYHNSELAAKLNDVSGFPEELERDNPIGTIISNLYRAIDSQTAVNIRYGDYGIDKKLYPRKGQNGAVKVYTVYPIKLIVSLGRCYLFCRHASHDNLSCLRVDRMIGVVNNRELPAEDNSHLLGNAEKQHYADRLYMYTDEKRPVTLRTDSGHINDVIDWFGSSLNFRKIDDATVEVTVNTSAQAMVYWALQYSEYVTVTEPEDIVEKIRQTLKKAAEKYGV